MKQCECGGAIHPFDRSCANCGRRDSVVYWWCVDHARAMGLTILCLLLAFIALVSMLLSGCNSALVTVDKTYHFHAPVNYPTVTVERSNNAQGAGVQR
jgi:uncharacterized protein YceK